MYIILIFVCIYIVQQHATQLAYQYTPLMIQMRLYTTSNSRNYWAFSKAMKESTSIHGQSLALPPLQGHPGT